MNDIISGNRIILGLMRLKDVSVEKLEILIEQCLDLGIKFFDISDVYGEGDSERKLGEILKDKPSLRDKMIIQSKGGIVKTNKNISSYDLSSEYLTKALDNSLERLHTSYLDSYLLHRPDIFIEAEDLSSFVHTAAENKKIHHFGVSNFSVSAIDYLSSSLKEPIEINQMQVGLGHLDMLSYELNINMDNQEGVNRDGGLFFYMKKNHIVLQCWSPYQVGFFEGSIFKDAKMKKTCEVLDKLSKKYGVSACGIATAFLLLLGKDTQVITGSMDIDHIKDTLQATRIHLSKEDWYELYLSTGHMLP